MYIISQIIYLIAVVFSIQKIIKISYTHKKICIFLALLTLPLIYFTQSNVLLVWALETLAIIFSFYGEKISNILVSYLGISCVFTLIQLLIGTFASFFNIDTFFVNLISAVLLIIIAIIFNKIDFFERLKFNKSAQIFAINGIISLLLVTFIFVIIEHFFITTYNPGLIFLLILVILFMVSSQIVTYQFVQNIYKLNQNKLLYEFQKNSYENSMIKYKERLSFLHDVKAYISSLNRLLINDDVTGAKQLINEISGELKKNQLVYSNNQYINLIINEFENEFKNNSISFKYSEVILDEIKIESMDIISLFYNIISNALEAAKKSEDKNIEINVKLENNILYVDSYNSVSKSVDINKIKLGVTSKDDKDVHGIGLLNLNKIIKKYSGDMEWSATEIGMFKLEIFILIQ